MSTRERHEARTDVKMRIVDVFFGYIANAFIFDTASVSLQIEALDTKIRLTGRGRNSGVDPSKDGPHPSETSTTQRPYIPHPTL